MAGAEFVKHSPQPIRRRRLQDGSLSDTGSSNVVVTPSILSPSSEGRAKSGRGRSRIAAVFFLPPHIIQAPFRNVSTVLDRAGKAPQDFVCRLILSFFILLFTSCASERIYELWCLADILSQLSYVLTNDQNSRRRPLWAPCCT